MSAVDPSPAFVLADLARRLGGQVEGDDRLVVRGVATLRAAGPGDVSFLTHPRYREQALDSRAGAILVSPGTALEGRTVVVVAHPYAALAELLALFYPEVPEPPGVDSRASLDPSASIGARVSIGPFAVVGAETKIGDRVTIGAGTVIGRGCDVGADTVLRPRVVLYPGTRVGARCLVHSGVVLGADGYGFATVEGIHRKIPQVGRVVVGDDVEIGANSAIDRGTLEDTVIGSGTKIDDLVMIGHGVRVGRGCLLVAQSGIAGSTSLGDHVVLAGQSGVAGHIRIGDRCVVASKSAVFDDLASGTSASGIPAQDHRAWKRVAAVHKRLPEMRSELLRLGRRLEALERRVGGRGALED